MLGVRHVSQRLAHPSERLETQRRGDHGLSAGSAQHCDIAEHGRSVQYHGDTNAAPNCSHPRRRTVSEAQIHEPVFLFLFGVSLKCYRKAWRRQGLSFMRRSCRKPPIPAQATGAEAPLREARLFHTAPSCRHPPVGNPALLDGQSHDQIPYPPLSSRKHT